MLVEEKVRNYILENFLFSDDISLIDYDDSFMEKGIIDSTGILEVVHFLEEEFELRIEDDEMIPDNLDSINKIKLFLATKKA